MKTATWIILGLAVLIVLCIGLYLGAGFPGYGNPGGMMGGWGSGELMVMGLIWVAGFAFLGVLVLGVVWLVKQTTQPAAQPPVIGAVCPSCHKGVQADWKTCPYCEQKLKS